jgi:polysaccharide biosynthesis protein PslH
MKRSIIICHYYPFPETSGISIRTMNFVRFFKNMGSVDIAYTYKPKLCFLDDTFNNRYIFKNTEYPTDYMARTKALLKGRPYPVRAYKDQDKRFFSNIVKENNYDYILVRYITNAYNLFGLSDIYKKRVIIDFDDVITDSYYESLFYDSEILYKKMLRVLNKMILLGYQKKCAKLNISLFCNEEDRKKLDKKNINAFVVPNIYANKDFEKYEFGNGANNEKILLFVGSLSYGPNIKGLTWFIESIFPKFKDAHSDAKLVVVGNLSEASNNEIEKLCKSAKDIELYTNVLDISEFYRKSMVVIVPILTGGGTRIKILEAALSCRPILTTIKGAEGFDLKDGKELLFFDDAEGFLRKFNSVCKPDIYNELCKNAKDIVLSKYSIKNFEIAMKRAIKKIDTI